MRNLDDLDDLSDELKNVLRREEAPDGFADRVLRRVEGKSAGEPLVERIAVHRSAPPRSRPNWYQLAAAAALVLAIGGGVGEYRAIQRQRAERAAGEAATAQLMLALEIAGAKLQLVQTKIHALHDGQSKNTNQ
jgi:hypothetical protein